MSYAPWSWDTPGSYVPGSRNSLCVLCTRESQNLTRWKSKRVLSTGEWRLPNVLGTGESRLPRCPMYRGVKTLQYFVSQNSPLSYLTGSRDSLVSYVLGSWNSHVSYVPGNRKTWLAEYQTAISFCWIVPLRLNLHIFIYTFKMSKTACWNSNNLSGKIWWCKLSNSENAKNSRSTESISTLS